jgi:hypothetical protein
MKGTKGHEGVLKVVKRAGVDLRTTFERVVDIRASADANADEWRRVREIQLREMRMKRERRRTVTGNDPAPPAPLVRMYTSTPAIDPRW